MPQSNEAQNHTSQKPSSRGIDQNMGNLETPLENSSIAELEKGSTGSNAESLEDMEEAQSGVTGENTTIDQLSEEMDPSSDENETTEEVDLQDLEAKQEELEEEMSKPLTKNRKQELIQQEKEELLKEKLETLVNEFKAFGQEDFNSILSDGLTSDGQRISSSLGEISPETAIETAEAINKGKQVSAKNYEKLITFLSSFDEELSREAEERINERQKLEQT